MKICPICENEHNKKSGTACYACSNWYGKYKTKKKIVDMLGGQCTKCGLKDIECLQLHHKDPSTKSFTIGQYYRGKNYKTIEDEAYKCELLCANCHVKFHNPHRQNVVDYYEKYSDRYVITCKSKYFPHPKARKVERPSKEELERLVWSKPSSQIRKEFGLNSDSTITYWCQFYGISKPTPGYWTQQKASSKIETETLRRKEELVKYWNNKYETKQIIEEELHCVLKDLDNMSWKQIYRQYYKRILRGK